ncbi:MAG: phosphate signaling complex protein PhoU [Myxococcota bacterium]
MVAKISVKPTLETEVQEIRNRILLMAGYVEQMIAASVRALSERDANLARATISIDRKVNLAECEVDELCLHVLAKRQPQGIDLRFVTLALKMVTDLERIGDLAVNICERAIDLSQGQPLRSYEDIHRMAAIVQGMVKDAIDAFVDRSVVKARGVIVRDDEVDALYNRAFQEILEMMITDRSDVRRGIHFQSVAKWLERMADHSTNLAEQVIFLVEGTDVRRPRQSIRGRLRK